MNSKCKSSRTFTAPSVWAQLVARLTRTLIAAQSVQTSLLTAPTVRFGTLIFLYKDSEREQLKCFVFTLTCKIFWEHDMHNLQ